jgi:SAM-dependent methyltransferase
MFRKIYYSLSPAWRLRVRRLVFAPLDWLPGRHPLAPPRGMIYTGSGDFIQQGKDMVALFRAHSQLHESSRVLDIGSGIGRMAVGLTSFLKGPYRGFDAVAQGVSWCQTKISPKFPHFEFTYVDLLNDLYKSTGDTATTFVFPYAAEQFDFACSISVFTHMVPAETERYLHESARVLAPGGELFATFFVYETVDRLAANPNFKFPYIFDHYALMDEKVVSANVAYQADWLRDVLAAAELKVIKILPGWWSDVDASERPGARFQDIWVVGK